MDMPNTQSPQTIESAYVIQEVQQNKNKSGGSGEQEIVKRYVIHQMNFAYNDEFFVVGSGRTLSKVYDNQAVAYAEWIKLERQAIKDMPLTQRGSLQIYKDEYYQKNWKTLIAKLTEYGITGKDGKALSLPKGLFHDGYYDGYLTDEDLNIDKLTDEQLLDVLQVTDSNNYLLAEYGKDDSIYTLYFTENDLAHSYRQGYLVLSDEYAEGYENIMQADGADDLPNEDIFYDVYEEDPIATYFTEKDKSNPLVQSLLTQYADSFILFEEAIYYINDDVAVGVPALKAMNAVLDYPFYEIRKHSPDEITQLQKDDTVLKTIYKNTQPSKRYQRYLDYVNKLLDKQKPKQTMSKEANIGHDALSLWQRVWRSLFGR